MKQVKKRNPIETVIGRYVSLTYKGYKATGLCPFHDDHNPSLQVDTAKQTFICYACGAKGDVIEFVQKIEQCSFREAIKKLNQPLPQHTPLPPKGRVTKSPELTPPSGGREVNWGFDFEAFLASLMPYMAGHSDLTPTYLDFEVGVAPMLSKNPLKGRIIFPIRDEEGVLKGFAGRIAPEARDNSLKYLNTTAASGFERANLLYGLHRARKTIAETGTMYITEGYKDAIAMHAAGFTNTVALCGTILAQGQIALIQKYARKVYLVMDGDRAGKEAAAKIRRQLAGLRIEVKTVILPDGEDPDSLFRILGKNSFKEYIFATGIPAGIPEYLIVTACLLFPEVKLRTQNGEQYIFEILLSIIETDRLPVERKDHRELLDCLSCSNAGEISSGNLATLAGQLKAKHGPAINRLYCSYLEENNQDRPAALTDLMHTLLFFYAEYRSIEEISRLRQELHHITDYDQRDKLLEEINFYNDLLNTVCRRLERPSAIPK